MKRRSLIAVAFLALFIGQASAQPQGYPAKVVRIIIGFPPGGSLDIAARVMATRLAERIGQSVIVENRVGAASIIGVDAVAKAAPDGHTIGFATSGAITITPSLRTDMPFNALTDLAPVAMAVHNPLLLVAHPSVAAKDVAGLIALAKASRARITFGTPGNGTTMHLAGLQLNLMAGIDLQHVPYKGTSPAANDLVGGHIPIAIIDVATARDFIRHGRMKALGVTGPRRTTTAPDIPTVAESGLPGYGVTSWLGIIAPGRTPPEIIKYLNSHIVAVLAIPEVRERYIGVGLEPAPSTPEELGSAIRTETAAWAKLIKDNRITAE
jgi:tripartite-type tricarboxylate transporter receptor subunit TctC